jgi:hypothetical protein
VVVEIQDLHLWCHCLLGGADAYVIDMATVLPSSKASMALVYIEAAQRARDRIPDRKATAGPGIVDEIPLQAISDASWASAGRALWRGTAVTTAQGPPRGLLSLGRQLAVVLVSQA